MNNNISYSKAISAALESVSVESYDAHSYEVSLENGLYDICFRTDWQKYECMVDAVTGEVMGISSEPSIDLENVYNDGTAIEIAAA